MTLFEEVGETDLEEVRNWVLIGEREGGDELEYENLGLMRYDVADSKKGPFSRVLCTASRGI
jgi:hypothetical protein